MCGGRYRTQGELQCFSVRPTPRAPCQEEGLLWGCPFRLSWQKMQALLDDGVNRLWGWESKIKIPLPHPSLKKKLKLSAWWCFFPLSESSVIFDKPACITMETRTCWFFLTRGKVSLEHARLHGPISDAMTALTSYLLSSFHIFEGPYSLVYTIPFIP